MSNYLAWDCTTANYTTTSGTTNLGYASGSIVTSNPPPHSTKSISFTATSGSDSPAGPDAADSDRITNQYAWAPLNGRSLYYRFWLRIGSTFNWGTGDKQKAKIARTAINNGSAPGGGLIYTMYINSDGFDLSEGYWAGTDSPIMTSGDHFAAVSVSGGMATYADNTWHEWIIRVKPNTTATSYNGEFQVYLDGTNVGSYNAFRLLSNAPNDDSGATNWVTLYGSALYQDIWSAAMIFPYFQMTGVGAGGPMQVSDFSVDDVFNSNFGGGDITNPVCTITTPTSQAVAYLPAGVYAFAGTASDDVAVSSVTWTNSAGGGSTATGTTAWSFNATVSPGLNIIVVTATDSSGNTGTDTLTIYTTVQQLRPASVF